jgi:hypothetical protein
MSYRNFVESSSDDGSSDNNNASDAARASNYTEAAAGRRLRGVPPSNIASRVATPLNPRAAAFKPIESGSGLKPKVNTLHDLEALVKKGHRTILREGITTTSSNPQIGSAILFEARKDDFGLHGATKVRYLPLVSIGGRTVSNVRSAASESPTPRSRLTRRPTSTPTTPTKPTTLAVPMSEDRPLDILPEAKRHIDRARARLSLDRAPVAEPEAASSSIPNSSPTLSGSVTATMQSDQSPGQWPSGQVPVEIFEMITHSLSHRDVSNMRLVCKEFESKASPALFKEVVVPFTAGLYDMIEEDVSARLCNTPMLDRNGDTDDFPSLLPVSRSHRANEDGMYYRKSSDTAPGHGLRVFEGFGPHMNKFGIRFEVTEADLSGSFAKKIDTKHIEAYHGGYDWPPPGYARFGRLARLEKIADETPRMTAALATLVNVREIGLSLDSGLGFLGGPDRSPHDMIFQGSTPMFESALLSQPRIPDAGAFWRCLQKSHSCFTNSDRLAQERFVSCVLASGRDGSAELPTVAGTEYDDTSLWPSLQAGGVLSGIDLTKPARGIFYTTHEDVNVTDAVHVKSPPLSPACLTSEQKQWILETSWAQSAFLDTYILAISDNPQVFHQITKVTISKMSSGLLTKLDHDAFWDALPNVEDVTLLVGTDWREVCKDEAGCAITPPVEPSLAVTTFRAVIRCVAQLENIKKLRFGYTDGGENAKGMFGRNMNLMPAPIAVLDQLLSPDPQSLSFDHVRDLTLVNCWITPCLLMHLASTRTAGATSGKMLTLDSVSLTANTRLELQDSAHINIGTIHDFREGCWPALINELACLVEPIQQEPELSINFADPGAPEPEPLPAPYQKITFTSCGYVVLPYLTHHTFDQSSIEVGPDMRAARFDQDHGHHRSVWWRHRAEQIRPHMLSSKDNYIGKIVPWIGAREVAVFRAWRMQVWPSAGEGADAEYDGFPRRGTGRFWGCVQTKETPFSAMGLDPF